MVLAAIILPIILAVFFTLLHRLLMPYQKSEKIKKRLGCGGIEAQAVLLKLEHTGTCINKLPQVKLRMKVLSSTNGHFISETHEVLTLVDLAKLPVGCIVRVKYNPCDFTEIMLVR